MEVGLKKMHQSQERLTGRTKAIWGSWLFPSTPIIAHPKREEERLVRESQLLKLMK